jgi:hypothetical protein
MAHNKTKRTNALCSLWEEGNNSFYLLEAAVGLQAHL